MSDDKGGILMTIQERINALRQLMKKKKIDVYIVPSSDNHQSEYVGDYFKSREYITGFTGSAGTAVITQTEVGLWTDGRYFIQAENELAGSDITLYKQGILAYLKSKNIWTLFYPKMAYSDLTVV